MNSNGKNVKRISFGKGRYATPVWSPKGDLIAFKKIEGLELNTNVKSLNFFLKTGDISRRNKERPIVIYMLIKQHFNNILISFSIGHMTIWLV